MCSIIYKIGNIWGVMEAGVCTGYPVKQLDVQCELDMHNAV